MSDEKKPIWDMVIDDMRARDALGRERYGTRLVAGNGRDALVDAYEEALDLCVYLRQAIAEREKTAKAGDNTFAVKHGFLTVDGRTWRPCDSVTAVVDRGDDVVIQYRDEEVDVTAANIAVVIDAVARFRR